MVALAYKRNPSAFFRLPGTPTKVDFVGFQSKLLSEIVEGVIYEPNTLNSPYYPSFFVIRNRRFVNISLSSTVINRFEFKKCQFEDCLFQSTVFKECRFDECVFIRCNTNKIEFTGTYISPDSFAQCLDRFYHANLGKYLFQQLLANSQRESQPEFAFTAQYQFGLWTKYQDQYNFDYLLWNKSMFVRKLDLFYRINSNRLFCILMGYGARLSYFVTSSTLLIAFFSSLNYSLRATLGLTKICNFYDALYFSIITLATVGYGDISPESSGGKMLIACEAIVGVFMFATLTSMLLKRLIG